MAVPGRQGAGAIEGWGKRARKQHLRGGERRKVLTQPPIQENCTWENPPPPKKTPPNHPPPPTPPPTNNHPGPNKKKNPKPNQKNPTPKHPPPPPHPPAREKSIYHAEGSVLF